MSPVEEEAINDIENIRDYIEKDSKLYADCFIAKVVKGIEKIPLFPSRGRIVSVH